MSAYFLKPPVPGDTGDDGFDSGAPNTSPAPASFSGTSPSFASGSSGPSLIGSGASDAPGGGSNSASSTSSTTAIGDASGDSTATISKAGNGLVFVDNFSASCTQAFINCVEAAQETYLNLFDNNITLNFNFTETNDGNSGDLATNSWSWSSDSPVSYSTLKSALEAKAAAEPNNIYLQDAVATLPASDPSGGLGFYLPSEYAQMLGLTGSSVADSVTLNTYYSWSFGQDVINAMEHEMSEGGMGRVGGLGVQNSAWSTMDLFSYNASGAPDYSTTDNNRVFSYDGGATTSASAGLFFFRPSVGDAADYREQDVYGTGNTGETNYLSQTDLEMMAVLGWQRAPVDQDFFGQSISQMFWQNTSSGDVGEWITNTTGQISAAPALGNASGYTILGAGDFTGNGTSDIFWELGNGEVGEWQMTNGQITNAPLLGTTTLNIVAFGDFTGNNIDDVFWQNGSNGAIGEWLLNSSGAIQAAPSLGNAPGYQIIGAGDFTGNGIDDILWQNGNTVGEWLMNSSGQISAAPSLGTTSSQILGIGDFTGNGTDDVLWRSGNTVGEWIMSNGQISQNITLGAVSSTWQFIGVGNYTGNGIDDMIWRDTSTGSLTEWQMVGGQINAAPGLGSATSNFDIIARK